MSPVIRAALGAPLVLFGLACGGLPIGSGDVDGAATDAPATDGAPASTDGAPDAGGEGEGEDAGEGEGEGEGEDAGEGEGEGADVLFPALDPNQEPPHKNSALKCPDGTMVLKVPRKTLNVYCATGGGTRSGPYTEWSGKWLVVAATNVDGKLEGQWTRWQRAGDTVRKVEERTYAAGVEQGDHAEWDAEGRLLVRGRMVDGKRDGRFVERKVEGGEVVPGGACYRAGEEQWRTADEAELVSKDCGGEAVAEG